MSTRTFVDKGGSRIRPLDSSTRTIDATGIVIDWPVNAGGHPFETIEVDVGEPGVVGADLFLRSGDDDLVAGDVVTESQAATAHDRRIKDGDVISNIQRFQPDDTKLGLRCKTGETALVLINPGA